MDRDFPSTTIKYLSIGSLITPPDEQSVRLKVTDAQIYSLTYGCVNGKTYNTIFRPQTIPLLLASPKNTKSRAIIKEQEPVQMNSSSLSHPKYKFFIVLMPKYRWEVSFGIEGLPPWV